MSHQYDLFGNQIPVSNIDEEKLADKKNTQLKSVTFELVLSENTSKKDAKNKTAIENKIGKIDQLKVQIKKLHQDLDLIKQLHQELVSGEEITFYKLKEEFAIKLYKRSNEKGFALWQKEVMEDLILETCTFLINASFYSETLQNIQKEIFEHRTNNMDAAEKEMANEIFGDFFAEMGVDLDMDDFDFTKFTQEEFQEKFKANFHEKQHEQEAEFMHQEKNKKVQQTDKTFRKIYKALVKKAHPDLVIDENEKSKREEWMKRLSKAWEERNYYQLLMLQKEIDTNAEINISLESDQLKSLTEQLNEEIRVLEVEKWRIKNNEDENGFYFSNFHARTKKGIEKKLKEYQKHIEYQKHNTQLEIDNLKTKVSTKNYLKDAYKTSIENPFDFLDDFDFH
jgi:hypothetical protein